MYTMLIEWRYSDIHATSIVVSYVDLSGHLQSETAIVNDTWNQCILFTIRGKLYVFDTACGGELLLIDDGRMYSNTGIDRGIFRLQRPLIATAVEEDGDDIRVIFASEIGMYTLTIHNDYSWALDERAYIDVYIYDALSREMVAITYDDDRITITRPTYTHTITRRVSLVDIGNVDVLWITELRGNIGVVDCECRRFNERIIMLYDVNKGQPIWWTVETGQSTHITLVADNVLYVRDERNRRMINIADGTMYKVM